MKCAYPIIISPAQDEKESYVVYFPDFNSGTQGETLADAIDMAADAIGILGITMEDDGDPLPEPTPIDAVKKEHDSDIVTLVSVDFAEYRRKNDNRAVRRNVSLPAWLDEKAREAGINVSAILTSALKRELGA